MVEGGNGFDDHTSTKIPVMDHWLCRFHLPGKIQVQNIEFSLLKITLKIPMMSNV